MSITSVYMCGYCLLTKLYLSKTLKTLFHFRDFLNVVNEISVT